MRILLLLFLFTSAAGARNVLLIILDDWGADSWRVSNSSTAASFPPTPNIDALAAGGVRFTNGYANPVCSPTRACILTGRHGFRTGVGEAVVGAGTTPLSASEFTLPEAFAAAANGYSVAQFGKWHLSNGNNSPSTVGGWPHFAGPIIGALPDYNAWTKVTNGVSQSITTYATTETVNDAVTWITARGSQPWFVWLALNAPHTPLHKPPNALHSYDALPGTTPHINNNPRLYYEAAVEAADSEIGRLLASVNRSNTDIILIGDNGTPPNTIQSPQPSAHAKDTLYEGGIKVPFLINGPSVVHPGRTNASLVHVVDLFATILELSGISPAAVVPSSVVTDSRSLLPLIQDQAETEARYAYAELFGSSIQSVEGGQSLRNGQFKLIRFVDKHEEFYDVTADPAESTKLSSGSLSSTQLANYYALKLRLANYQDEIPAPAILSAAAAPAGFSVSVARDTSLTYSLWRSSDLSELSWAPLGSAVSSSTATTITLTDPSAAAGRAFYRVLGER